MEIPQLFQQHEAASRQVEILERRLSELQHYPVPESEHEFNHIKFQISVAKGVKKMYEEYRNNKWCQLQEEATHILQEVLGSQTSPEPMEEDGILTPPLSPPTSPSRHTLYDATILNIPPPLSPLTDDEDFMLTPPRTPSRQGTRTDRQRPTRNLSSLFSAMQRDL